jgi:hypothetical protein
MKTETAPDTLAVPPDLLAEIQAEADKEHRSAGDVLRDLVERGLGERRWKAHAEAERQRARELGLPDADDQPMTDEYRQVIREKIAQGMRSLREGRVTDGEAFMARMDAELAELERQGH